MKRILFTLLLAGLLGQAAGGNGTAPADRKLIEGTWLPVKAELGGKALPEDVLKTIRLTLADGKYTVKVGEKLDQGTFQLDPAAKPKTIDITGTDGPNKGKTILAIYELTPDALRVCYDLEGQRRPTEFKSAPNSKHFLVTYQRGKP